MEPLSLIERLTEKVAPGRSPSFMEAHLLKALEFLSSGSMVGRKRLGELLGLSEGVVRTFLRRLKGEGLIEVTRRGMVLTRRGERLLAALNAYISYGTEVPRSSLTIGPQNFAILVKGARDHIRRGVEQRDAALKAGALGATTLVFDGERLVLPGIEEPPPSLEEVYKHILSKLRPNRGDVIIIGSSTDSLSAELGAKTAGLELLKSMKKDSRDKFSL